MIDLTRVTRMSALILCGTVAVSSAAAQDAPLPPPRFHAVATGTAVTTTTFLANGSAEMAGMMLGGEGLLRWKRFSLRAGYAQGTIGFGESQLGLAAGDDDGGVVGRMLDDIFVPGRSVPGLTDLETVEGFASVGWSAIAGLELSGGVQGRARFTDSDSERLIVAVLRARYEAPLLSETVRGYLEGWSSVAGTASNPEGSGSARGGSAGMLAAFGRVGVRLSYGIDESRYRSTSRREIVEGVTLGLGYVVR